MKKQLLRYAAGVLAAGALTLVPTGPAVAAAGIQTADLPTPEITTSAGAESLVPYGTGAAVTFVVKADGELLKRRLVQTCTAVGAGNFACVKTYTSTKTGAVVVARPKVTAPWRVKVVVPADGRTGSATSDTVVVAPKVGLTLARRGSTLTVTLTGAANQYLMLERRQGSEWEFAGVVLDVNKARLTITGLEKGVSYRVLVSDTPTIAGATSATV